MRLKLVLPMLIFALVFSRSMFAQTESPVDRRAELKLVSADFELADGPSWDGWSLTVPDVKGEKLFRYIPAKKQMLTLVPEAGRISATYFNHGRHFLSDNKAGGLAFVDGNKKKTIVKFKSEADQKRPYRPNDLVVDRTGGVYITFTPQNQVLYISPNGEQSIAVENVQTPNGIALSPDESVLYVSEFVPKKIKAFDVTSPGKTANGRVLAAMDDGPERGADGMCVDRTGNIYCAGPTAVWIWGPSGKLLDKIDVPEKPINCVFGGRQMRTLYITGFGGLHSQLMKVNGVSPQKPGLVSLKPAAENPPKQNAAIPATDVPDSLTPYLDQVFASYGDRKLLADIFVPSSNDNKPMPCVVVVYGGGWHNGDKSKFRALAVALAQQGFVTAAIEYRLAGEAAFPAAIHDCHAAVRFLRANAAKFQIDPNRIGAVGGSAGGHLTGLMASGGGNPKLQGDGGNPEQSSRISASIVMAGPMEMLTGSVAANSRKSHEKMSKPDFKLDPAAKPLSNSNSWLRSTVDENPDLYRLADAFVQIDKETCPILFMVGEHDNPARNQPSRDKLTSLGIKTGLKTYKDGQHGCWNRNPWFGLMVTDMVEFFRATLK